MLTHHSYAKAWWTFFNFSTWILSMIALVPIELSRNANDHVVTLNGVVKLSNYDTWIDWRIILVWRHLNGWCGRCSKQLHQNQTDVLQTRTHRWYYARTYSTGSQWHFKRSESIVLEMSLISAYTQSLSILLHCTENDNDCWMYKKITWHIEEEVYLATKWHWKRRILNWFAEMIGVLWMRARFLICKTEKTRIHFVFKFNQFFCRVTSSNSIIKGMNFVSPISQNGKKTRE